ncbi:unnamed protein product [Blepharisma stoltei]|uniref:Uncharacterized protein n=1 Tax=Blepharisma stoltei TaxID=1481888 RepID=A0AAU9JRS4_9CILI|nr:unnamed protein product [Blepharisma stoltei]
MHSYPSYVYQGYDSRSNGVYNPYMHTPQKKRKFGTLEEGFFSLSLGNKESKVKDKKEDIEMSSSLNIFKDLNIQGIPNRIFNENHIKNFGMSSSDDFNYQNPPNQISNASLPINNINCNNIVIANFNNGTVESRSKMLSDLSPLLASLDFENQNEKRSFNPPHESAIKNQKMIMPPSLPYSQSPKKRNRDEDCMPIFIGIKDKFNGFKIVPIDAKIIKKLMKKEKQNPDGPIAKYIQIENMQEMRAELECLNKRIIEFNQLIKVLDQKIYWNNQAFKVRNDTINGYPTAQNCYMYANIWYDECLRSDRKKLLIKLLKRKRWLESQLKQQYIVI